ncbi:YciI family protein [Chloroflexota bacterium]
MATLKQYLYTVQVARIGLLTDPSEQEKRIAGEHVAYMKKLTEEGVGIFGGAVNGIRDSRHLGLFVFQAEDDAAARIIVDDDPAVKARLMRVCLFPYRIALWNAAALQLESGQQHYLYHIQAIRPEQGSDGTAWEIETTMQHFYYLKEQTEKGVFCIVGRTQTHDYSTFGMGVLRASSNDEAWEISANDPGVINPVMRLKVLPFGISIYREDWEME